MILIIFIAARNGLGLMSGDIVNALCTAPCAEMFGLSVVRNLVLDVVRQWYQSRYFTD